MAEIKRDTVVLYIGRPLGGPLGNVGHSNEGNARLSSVVDENDYVPSELEGGSFKEEARNW